MGVRWKKKNGKPSDFFEKKRLELHDIAIPVIARMIADGVEDKAMEYSPVGVEWTPPGAKNQMPVPSGKLKKSWKKSRVGRWVIRDTYIWKVWTDVDYAPYVEYGTSPHTIRPKTKEALVYWNATGKHGAEEVRHPGTKPVYMLSRAVNETKAVTPWAIGKPVLENWAKGKLSGYRIHMNSPY